MSAKAEKTEGAAGKKKLPMPLIIGVVLLFVGLFVGKSVLGGSKKEAKSAKKEKAEVGISLPLDEFMVNLNGSGDHYLRAQIALGLRKGMTEEEGKEHSAPMRDAILSILSSKTSGAGLPSPKTGKPSKKRSKPKVNEATVDEKEKDKETVVKVYFTAFATQ